MLKGLTAADETIVSGESLLDVTLKLAPYISEILVL
jgi:hypothetical protein